MTNRPPLSQVSKARDSGLGRFSSMMVGPVRSKDDIAHWVHDRTQFVRHNKNSVYIAISAIARKMAMQEARVSRKVIKKSGTKLESVDESHPLVQLIREVNPFMNEWELWYYNEGWKLLTGDSYIWKARNGFGTVKQLWPIPSQFVWAVPAARRFVGKYRVESFFRGMGSESYINQRDMVHIQEPNLNWESTGRFYGFAPLSAAGATVDIENNIFERLNNGFRNYAQPGQIFSSDQRFTDTQLRQLYSQIISQHSLAEQYGKPMIVHAGMKPMMQNSSIREMDYSKSLDVTLRLTLAVFGVPMAVVGLVQDANRSNMEAATQQFCEGVINPRLKQNAQNLTYNVAREFGDDLVIHFDPCTTGDAEFIRKAVETAANSGAVTPNEIRQMLFGSVLDDFETGGDQPVVNAGMEQTEYGQVSEEEIEEQIEERLSRMAEASLSGESEENNDGDSVESSNADEEE